MWLALALGAILICLLAYLDVKKPKNFPPGPAWWPILGSALTIERKRRKENSLSIAAYNLAKEYGDGKLVGLRVGVDRQVIVMCPEVAKELAACSEFDGRPKGPFFRFRTWGLRRGILLVDGEFWREQRRFLLRHLREFGFGKTKMMENIILREVESLVNYFKTIISNSPGGVATVPLHDAFGVSMLNSIWAMLAGVRYEPDEIEIRKLQRIISDMFDAMDMTGCLFNHFPMLRFFAPEASGYAQYMRTHRALWSFIQEELLRHEANHVPGVARDFMDVFINEMKANGQDPTSTFSELQLLAICIDMFMAGSDTTNKSLSFAFLHFMRQPQVVAKVQEELDRVVGRERMPTIADRPNLPYMDATVHETLRMFTGQGFALPRRAMKDCTLRGYHIPKDTTVVFNLQSFHMNEERYPDPWIFRPERFLDEEGKVKVPEYFLPFGAGRRMCIGDNMAKANIFLFISNLLHIFNFRNPKGSPLPDPFPREGITPTTQPYEGEISLRC